MIIIKTDTIEEFREITKICPDLLKGFSVEEVTQATTEPEPQEEVREEVQEVSVGQPRTGKTRYKLNYKEKIAIAELKEIFLVPYTEAASRLGLKRITVKRWYEKFNDAGSAIDKFSLPGKNGNINALRDYVTRLYVIRDCEHYPKAARMRAVDYLSYYHRASM